jgi:hypothetical protein
MEEVVGSIPTRSTIFFNDLDRASAGGRDMCVMVCVITRRSGACSKGFHRVALRFHATWLYRSSIHLLTLSYP